MIPEGLMYGFCIGNGHTGEKLPEIWVGNMQKLKENDRFCMNGVFRGAFGPGIGSNGSKNALVAIMRSVFSQKTVLELF